MVFVDCLPLTSLPTPATWRSTRVSPPLWFRMFSAAVPGAPSRPSPEASGPRDDVRPGYAYRQTPRTRAVFLPNPGGDPSALDPPATPEQGRPAPVGRHRLQPHRPGDEVRPAQVE